MTRNSSTEHPDAAGSVSWETAANGPPPDYEHFPEVRAGINPKPLPARVGPQDAEAMHRYMSHLDHTAHNPMGTPFYLDPERTLTLGSFTAFVGVAFSDQTRMGCGQLGVRRGFHHDMEQFFRMQRAAGGPIGYEGPGWPRVDPASVARGTPRMGMPAPLLQPPQTRHGGLVDVAGWRDGRGKPYTWITPVVLEEGDAVVALHGLPHAGTANHSPHTRYSAYCRVRRFRPRNPYEGDPRWLHGTRDQNDRLPDASAATFDYARYNPYRMTIDHLCDMWSQWDGMQETVVRERMNQGGRYPVRLEFPVSPAYSSGRLPPVEVPQETPA